MRMENKEKMKSTVQRRNIINDYDSNEGLKLEIYNAINSIL